MAMAREIIRSFNDERPLLVEAGTGIGKSLAYLLPALQWLEDNDDERVLVSTATIALQQQIMDKDLPLAQKFIGKNIKTALVKGRGNYICLKRLSEMDGMSDLFSYSNEIDAVHSWTEQTSSGDRSDLPFNPSRGLWERICCESDSCTGRYCPFFERCFFIKSKRHAAAASLLVSNHHLLFADLAARLEEGDAEESMVLPPYSRIIFDEAHHVEPCAASLFSAQFSLPGLNRYLQRFGKHRNGLLPRIMEKQPNWGERLYAEIPRLVDISRAKAENLDTLGISLLMNTNTLRLTGEPGEAEKNNLLEPMEELRDALAGLEIQFTGIMQSIDFDDSDQELSGLAVEAEMLVVKINDFRKLIDSFLHRFECPEDVFWLDTRRSADGNDSLQCHRTPLSVANVLKDALWAPYNTVIGVSATLTLDGNFQHWRSRVGADSIEAQEAVFPSPFDYASRVMLGIHADAPEPTARVIWEKYLIETISQVLALVGGHALVLFTSYETLRNTLAGVRTRLDSSILAQGDDDRGRLLKRFREDVSSVLFATDSFWEGVDVPGDALRLVIITRLPFRPPSDPVSEAKGEAIAANGGNAFLELALPEAVTRFRQGFGRLMRHRSDYGVVLVMDSRIVRKNYGQLFINSLPPVSKSIKTTEGILRDMEEFLYRNNLKTASVDF